MATPQFTLEAVDGTPVTVNLPPVATEATAGDDYLAKLNAQAKIYGDLFKEMEVACGLTHWKKPFTFTKNAKSVPKSFRAALAAEYARAAQWFHGGSPTGVVKGTTIVVTTQGYCC